MYPISFVEAVRFELENQNDLLDVIHDSLLAYEDKLENQEFPWDPDNMTDEDDIQYNKYIDIFSCVLGSFPGRLYSNYVIGWYSFIEDMLIQLCKEMNLNLSIDIDYHDGFDKGIWRAKKFLEDGAGYKINEIHWRTLSEINKVRNHIVHKRGLFVFSNDKPENVQAVEIGPENTKVFIHISQIFYNYLQKHGIFGLNLGSYSIVPTYEYCKYLNNFADELFSKLFLDLGLVE